MATEQDDKAADLSRISEYLREIASFNRRGELARTLKDPDQRRAYELSDGKRSSEEIAKDRGISRAASSVRRWWSDWREQGFIEDEFTKHPRHRYVTFVLDLEGTEHS